MFLSGLYSETGDGTKPVTAHSIQRIRALFDREKADNQHYSNQPHHYVYPHHLVSTGSSGGMQVPPTIVSSGSHQSPNEQPQYFSQYVAGDHGDEFHTEGQGAGTTEVPVAPDSIKEGWLNCKISNIDGKVKVLVIVALNFILNIPNAKNTL